MALNFQTFRTTSLALGLTLVAAAAGPALARGSHNCASGTALGTACIYINISGGVQHGVCKVDSGGNTDFCNIVTTTTTATVACSKGDRCYPNGTKQVTYTSTKCNTAKAASSNYCEVN